jgi:hypothetical protein
MLAKPHFPVNNPLQKILAREQLYFPQMHILRKKIDQ